MKLKAAYNEKTKSFPTNPISRHDSSAPLYKKKTKSTKTATTTLDETKSCEEKSGEVNNEDHSVSSDDDGEGKAHHK